MSIKKKKESINYLLTDIPDFNKILCLYRQLHKATPTIPQVRKIQELWNKIEPDEEFTPPKQLF